MIRSSACCLFPAHRSPDQARNGFTLTELAIVLGIIGTVLGSIWAASGNAHLSQNLDKTHQDVLTIVQNVRAYYTTRIGSGMKAGDQTANLINAGIFPADMISGAKIYDAWGDDVTVGSQTAQDGLPASAQAFEIIFDATGNTMPSSICGRLLTGFSTPAVINSGLIGIGYTIGGNLQTPIDTPAGLAAITDTTFANCSNHFTLQFSLQ